MDRLVNVAEEPVLADIIPLPTISNQPTICRQNMHQLRAHPQPPVFCITDQYQT